MGFSVHPARLPDFSTWVYHRLKQTKEDPTFLGPLEKLIIVEATE